MMENDEARLREAAKNTEVLRSPRLSLGPRLSEFEDAMARYVGAEASGAS